MLNLFQGTLQDSLKILQLLPATKYLNDYSPVSFYMIDLFNLNIAIENFKFLQLQFQIMRRYYLKLIGKGNG
jgi:hypothetical protein